MKRLFVQRRKAFRHSSFSPHEPLSGSVLGFTPSPILPLQGGKVRRESKNVRSCARDVSGLRRGPANNFEPYWKRAFIADISSVSLVNCVVRWPAARPRACPPAWTDGWHHKAFNKPLRGNPEAFFCDSTRQTSAEESLYRSRILFLMLPAQTCATAPLNGSDH